jgi:hypothetical protein
MMALREAPEAAQPNRARCAAGGQPHHVTDGQGKPISGLLCEHHFDALARILRDIEREAALSQVTESGQRLPNLDPVPSMQIRWDRSGGSLASQQAPARLDVLVHTDHRHGTGKSEDDDDLRAAGLTASVLVVLHAWADHVRREHHLTRATTTVRLGWARSPRGPVCPRPCRHDTCGRWITDTIPAAPTITGERNLLTRQLPWIARQDWVGDMYRDLRQLRDQLRRANGTAPDDPLPGRCPNMINGRECGGPLWPVKPKHTSGQAWTGSTPSSVRCSACRQRWEGPSNLARLALIIETQSRAS